MPWWGILLIVVGCQGLFLLVWWLLTRNKGASPNKEIEDSTRKRLEAELEAEKKKTEGVNAANRELTAKFKEVAEWYASNKDKIQEDANRDFKRLAGDPASIDRWLNSFTRPVPASPDHEEAEDQEGGEGPV